MSEVVDRVIDNRGRTLEIHRDVRPIYSNPDNPFSTTTDEQYLVGHFVYSWWATIDGESANRRRVGQFFRRAREARMREAKGD